VPERALLYTRLSDPNDKDAPTLDNQERLLREYCEREGLRVVGVLREAFTGTELHERPELQKAIALARDGAFDVFLVRDLDRLTRSMPHLWVLKDTLERHGATLRFALQKFEDTPEGRLLMNVQAFAAEMEREKIVWRTREGLRARVRSGKPLAGPRAPYGYRWRDGEKSGYEVDEDEARVVRRVYAALAAGESAASLARILTVEGVPTAAGLRRWSTAQLCRLVRHPVYKGEAVSYRWRISKKKPGRKRPTREERPTEEWTVLPEGTAPAIVSVQLWNKAIRAMTGAAVPRSRPGAKSEHYLLSGGFAVCGSCGGALIGNQGRDKWRCYQCHANKRVTSDGCDAIVTVSQASLDFAVWEHVLRWFRDPKALRAAAARTKARLAKQAAPQADTRALDRLLATLQRKEANQTRELSLADDLDEAASWREQLRATRAERRRVEAEVDAARAAGTPLDEQFAYLDHLVATAPTPEELATATRAEKRALLAEYEVRVTVYRGDLRTAKRTGERWKISSLLEG
jgi:site-specific DNA recombinase